MPALCGLFIVWDLAHNRVTAYRRYIRKTKMIDLYSDIEYLDNFAVDLINDGFEETAKDIKRAAADIRLLTLEVERLDAVLAAVRSAVK
tara:strand:- start:249 stop:515 length:267 start_codon:yes stop_codon:yes gene_type:complete